MRDRLRRLAGFLADRLTVPERWIILAVLLVAIFGAFIKYCRERPQVLPPGTPGASHPPNEVIEDD
jgi:hypothetical protein